MNLLAHTCRIISPLFILLLTSYTIRCWFDISVRKLCFCGSIDGSWWWSGRMEESRWCSGYRQAHLYRTKTAAAGKDRRPTSLSWFLLIPSASSGNRQSPYLVHSQLWKPPSCIPMKTRTGLLAENDVGGIEYVSNRMTCCRNQAIQDDLHAPEIKLVFHFFLIMTAVEIDRITDDEFIIHLLLLAWRLPIRGLTSDYYYCFDMGSVV